PLPHPRTTPVPYTTLFRSADRGVDRGGGGGDVHGHRVVGGDDLHRGRRIGLVGLHRVRQAGGDEQRIGALAGGAQPFDRELTQSARQGGVLAAADAQHQARRAGAAQIVGQEIGAGRDLGGRVD